MVYCDRCDRSFNSFHAYEQHRRHSSSHWVCGECDRDFSSWLGLKEHYVQSPQHAYCQYCDEHFDYDDELEQHYERDHWYCEACRKVFGREEDLEQHYVKSPLHHYCAPCNRHFSSESNLRAHLNSSTHRPKDVMCPFRGCNMRFVSRSALILHLESGNCPSGADRASVNRFVRQLDRNNVITNPSRLLTNGDGEPHWTATQRSWNGSAYECFLCHNTFRALPDLNKHLASPRHQDKIYRCPLNTCGVKFNTLSGLCQHIESERCGVSRFGEVQRTLETFIRSAPRITAY
ncbi:hypothetical protein BDN72DRAFT_795833 [Pluteus cervinus]|uniref:Uncharacterized protein n=1 Tax=Pluteus cervinus TaxID=181527 RepID=A0ACD3AWG8_9AGAR|nr:hypothetical protein BDN72DRAFT_795833 [Pluteus cervinus]